MFPLNRHNSFRQGGTSLRRRGQSLPRASWVAGLVIVLAGLVATPAFASDLLINGVPVGKVQLSVQGLDGVTFEGCTTVKVEKGSVDVSCPSYDLKAAIPDDANPARASAPADSARPATLTRRYWAVPDQNVRGGTNFDIDLYVNSKWIRRFRNNDEQVAFEITPHLTPGRNRLLFVATKVDGQAAPGDTANYFRVVVGEGEISSGRVLIEQPLFEVRRTAAETKNVTEERELVTR